MATSHPLVSLLDLVCYWLISTKETPSVRYLREVDPET